MTNAYDNGPLYLRITCGSRDMP